jgi:hypothetical protein
MPPDKLSIEKTTGSSSQVTYIPGDGDPNRVMWNGIEFRANVPVTVLHSRTADVLERKETIGPEGDIRSKGVEVKRSMVELARGNPHFMVDGVKIERKEGNQRLPTDADQYRGYALGWIRESNTFKQLEQRWDGEASLRERCGIEPKDEAYLHPFLNARREQLKEVA